MYVFVTYAEDQMMGILARGLRIAEYFPKNEVFFWNSGDDKHIRKAGYRHINESFDNYLPPSEVKFPKGTKKIIFCDLPFNRPYQVSILIAAKERGIPVIVLENIYRRGQLKEKVYSNALKYVDAMTFNGLSFFGNEKIPRSFIIPPLIENPNIDDDVKKELFQRFMIPEDHKLIFSTGYNDESKKVILEIAKRLNKKHKNVTILITSVSKNVTRKENLVFAPRLNEKDYRQLLGLCDILLCKKGYLQILEGLALKKPVIPVGRFQGFLDDWEDVRIREIVKYYPDFKEEIVGFISSLLFNSSFRKNYVGKVSRLHDGSLDGSRKIADIIKKTEFHKDKIEKTLLLSLSYEKEMSIARKLIEDTPFVLPVFFSVPYHPHIPGNKSKPIRPDYDESIGKDNILSYGFNMTHHLASSDVYSLSTVMPWFESIFSNIDRLAKESDKIIIVGESSAVALGNIISKYRKKIKIIKV